MPVRPFNRDQPWLFPPHLDELIPVDHLVRFAVAFLEEIGDELWSRLGIELRGEPEGAPAYHPALLLSVWVYGFMTGIRSCRRLEAACREQVPYMWLTSNQKPDHNTLWRFYQEHREGMRELLKLTVQTAVTTGLVDQAIQAVDGSKVGANASRLRSYDQRELEKLLRRAEQAIRDLEAQNATGGEPPSHRLPQELSEAQRLRDQIKTALQKIEAGDVRQQNLTDEDAAVLKASQGYVVGYNAQAVASPLSSAAGRGGQIITAVSVVNEVDRRQLLPMLQQAEENAGRADMTLADAGYHSAANLAACHEEGRRVTMPEPRADALKSAYHKDAFAYDRESDTYTCPQGQILRYTDTKRDRLGKPVRRYRAIAKVCRACPAFGLCTRDHRHGRSLHVGPEDAALKRHREWMSTAEARQVYSRRSPLIEPVFGVIKEQQAGRRFLLRGLLNVGAEWCLLAAAFNLRTLASLWQSGVSRLAA